MSAITALNDWSWLELFTRLSKIFSLDIGDGSSLVFTKLDFWLFFLITLIVYAFVLSKRKRVISLISKLFSFAGAAILMPILMFRKNQNLVVNFIRGNEPLILRSLFLTLVSLFFFYKTSGLYMLLLVVSISVNYFLGNRIYKAPSDLRRKWIIAFSAIFNLLILGYFKYAYFFTDSFNSLFQTDFELVNHFAQIGNGFFGEGTFVDKILLPVGVSFFTFQNISYVVDIYRKEIEPVRNFFHYSFFVTFFPQLVMGPIVRARDFIPQITQPFSLSKEAFSWSVIQIIKGLTKKIVIADFLVVHFIDKILFTENFDFAAYPGFVYVIVMWAYSIHIYADFSGYTDIAIGLSRLMGFELKPNFNSPYKAVSVADFWRRWHISLGSWLRDYLYIPLGGNRTGSIGSYIAIFIIFVFLIFITQWYDLLWIYLGVTIIYLLGVAFVKNFKRYVHRDLNLIITMVVGGLWHGASENFVIWGAMNGLALLVFKYWSRIRSFFHDKWRFYYFFIPPFVLGSYLLASEYYPFIYHTLFMVFFAAWSVTNAVGLIFYLLWRKFFSKKYSIGFIIVFTVLTLIGFAIGSEILIASYGDPALQESNTLLFMGILELTFLLGLILYVFRAARQQNIYEALKKMYKSFWQIAITFNFITFTRIWFKLDEARKTPFEEAGLEDAKADALPMKLLSKIWNQFEFTWEYFVKFVDLFYVPLIIMVIGLVLHWLPNRIKEYGERAYTALPIPLQAVCIVVIIFLIYQAIGAEQPRFVYLQF